MGLIGSKVKEEQYADSYHITETFSNHIEWKHTVRRMNHKKAVLFSKEQVNVSYIFGNQPYVIYAIYDTEMKKQIQELSYDQPHITVCNCIFVFCARTDFQLHTNFPQVEKRSFFQTYFSNKWDSYQPDSLQWSTRHTYMALGFVIAACAEESIACSPVDTFHSTDLSELLDLPSHLVPTAILTIGSPD
jgi:nitroreductase